MKSKKELLYTQEFLSKKFSGKNMKEAYLKACKWFATNVLSKDELHCIQASYEKIYDEQSPTVVIHLYASLLEGEARAKHCNICKEMHKSFFSNEETNCSSCKLKSYQNRCEQHIKIKTEYCNNVIEGRIDDV